MYMYIPLALCSLVSTVASDTLYFSPRESSHKEWSVDNIQTTDGVMCPDGRSECSFGQTCCKLHSGAYGCCPYSKAVCCKDLLHCCPERYKCDLRRRKCARGRKELPLAENMPAKINTDIKLEDKKIDLTKEVNKLADGKRLIQDEIGLVKEENRLVENKITLTENENRLVKEENKLVQNKIHLTENEIKLTEDMMKLTVGELDKTKSQMEFIDNSKGIVCPGGQSQCPDGATCCKLTSGQYGCCPLSKAVCCSDHLHCCPNGTTCDVAQGKCTKGEHSILWLEKQPALPKVTRENAVKCPGGQSQCPDGSTCCKLVSGQYGCCPMPKAVCCSDHLHCCPSGTTCDVAQGKCNRGEHSIPWLEKQPALPKVTRENDVKCPGGQSQCPDGSTCCKLVSGQYGCCPMPKAVCCSDHLHCCPSGTTCDVAQGKCTKGEHSIPWVKKQPALSKVTRENAVICPGGESQCPDGSTCCKLVSGQYGCCPMAKAVCCSDHLHCCPNGTTCDIAQGKCNRGEESIPWLKKQPALPTVTVGNVICPDGQSQCPDGSTCCKLGSGQYGCCPLPKAVCCSDHVHCCPVGTTCDVSQGKCQRGYSTIRWRENQPSMPVDTVLTQTGPEVTCPDGQSKCPEKSTCCKLTTGQYGCCPLPGAICCSDDMHCCPAGSTCDTKGGSCKMGYHSVPWVTKFPARTKQTPDNKNIVCPEDHFICSGTTTGCCPLYGNTVCCSDDLHCCPAGSTCDIKGGNCRMGHHTVPWVTKVLAKTKPAPDNKDIVCPEYHFICSGITTGCCPLYGRTVCCSDDLHCCPAGSICDIKGGNCKMGYHTVPWVTKVPMKHKLDSEGNLIVCPDGKYQCPDGSTCCKLASGKYGCCPFPKALCCTDGRHCCPEGSTCDEKAGSCKSGGISLPWLEKQDATPIQ